MPPVTINLEGVTGLWTPESQLDAQVVVRGAPPANFSFAEQELNLNGAREELAELDGFFNLGFQGSWTRPLMANAR